MSEEDVKTTWEVVKDDVWARNSFVEALHDPTKKEAVFRACGLDLGLGMCFL